MWLSLGPRGRVLRALLVLVLLSPAPLLALPSAAAVAPQNPELCFDRDHVDTLPDAGLICADEEANYYEGQRVNIVPNANTTPTGAFVRVLCVDGCHELTGRGYYGVYRGHSMRFPDEFQDPGPTGATDGGNNAMADHAGRYNGTWQVDVFSGQSAQATATRQFHVWISNIFLAPNMTVTPGGVLHLSMGGVSGDASLSVQRRVPGGNYTTVFESSRTAVLGIIDDQWSVPKAEAAGILACGLRMDSCYRIVARGGGVSRASEFIDLRASIARINVEDLRGQVTLGGVPLPISASEVPLVVQRTQNVSFSFTFDYPGMTLPRGANMVPDDLNVDASGLRALRIAIEQVNVAPSTSGATSATRLDEALVVYQPSNFSWQGSWTVPKNLDINNLTYQMRLEERRDRYGNIVPETQLVNFTVTAAHVTPLVAHDFTQLPRTEDDYVGLRVLYHNGSAIFPDDLSAPLQGCFTHLPVKPIVCADPTGLEMINVTGEWNQSREEYDFHVRYPRTYMNLDTHQFWLLGTLENNQTDKYSNDIMSVAGSPFAVVPGSPHVNLTTTMRGLETDILERGQQVGVSAQVSFGDGKPFNRAVSVNATTSIPGTLIKRGPTGAPQSVEPFNLTLVDDLEGIWFAKLPLTFDDTQTPLGRWTMQFHVEDNTTIHTPTGTGTPADSVNPVANVNDTSFDVTIVPSPIRMQAESQPSASVQTGFPVRFKFSLYYPPVAGGSETPVPAGAVQSSLTAQIYRWNERTRKPFGAAVSPALGLQEKDGALQVEYLVPETLFAGTYAFVLKGADQSGNQIQQDAWSKPFITYAESITRQQLAPPAPTVQRGQSVAVIFDARPGDLGPNGAGVPQIALERLADAANATWVLEVRDVRINDSTLADHVGAMDVGLTVPLGLYRFELVGRDAHFHAFADSYSANFTVTPAAVERALFDAPPERVFKGQAFSFSIASERGDRITSIQTLRDGRATSLPAPITQALADHFNVTWSVPFEADPGNYTLRIFGRDLYGNSMEIDLPPIEVTAAELVGKFLGSPARSVNRGATATVPFGITYPNGDFYLASALPTVSVVDANGSFIAPATVTRQGLSFIAGWKPGDQTPLGDYAFELSGQGSAGNTFRTLRSGPFRVLPGAITRSPITDAPSTLSRLGVFDFVGATVPGDVAPEFTLEYYGTSTDVTPILFGNPAPAPTTTTPLVGRLDNATGQYAVHFGTDLRTPLGAYRITMRTTDRAGNAVVLHSHPWIVSTTLVQIQFEGYPPNAVAEGQTATFIFTAKYRGGRPLTPAEGTPSVITLFNGRPVAQRPDLEDLGGGRWKLTWSAPDTLPDGTYTFSVGGADLAGNPITSTATPPYPIKTTVSGSFLKVIPGPSPALLVLGVAALALALSAARRRR